MLLTTITRKFLLFTCFSFLGVTIAKTSVYAYSISLDSSSPIEDNGEFIYTYDITLEPGESLESDSSNSLILTGLAEVIDAQAFSPYIIPENGFDSTSANFDTIADPPIRMSFPGVIEITSTSSVVGSINYDAFYNDSNNFPTFASGQTQGPVAFRPIPLTFSPGLGLLISASFFSMYYLKQAN